MFLKKLILYTPVKDIVISVLNKLFIIKFLLKNLYYKIFLKISLTGV